MNQTPSEITNNISSTIGIGSGKLTEFKVNGKLKLKTLEWKQYIVVDANYGGLICDNKVLYKFGPEDTWSIKEQTVNGTSLNSVNASRIENVEELKRKITKKDVVINI
jgi:hypothetical protein